MFISRKRYEEALEKARKEGQEEVYEKMCKEDRFRYFEERIDRIARRLEEIDPRNNTCEGRCHHC